MATSGKECEQPAEQKADREAADVTKEYLCDGSVEWRKSDHRSTKCEGNKACFGRKRAHKGEKTKSRRGGHDFRDGHPVDSVHEIDDVDQPDTANEQEGAVEPPGNRRHNAH